MEAEYQRKDQNPSIIQSYLHILLAQIQRHIDHSGAAANSKKYRILFKRFKQELEKHFADNQTAIFYADQLHITPHHLNLICKEITSKTATAFIRASFFLEPKRLLTFTNNTISEIADELNFFDGSYFAKIFKKETGESPINFKHKMSEKYRTR